MVVATTDGTTGTGSEMIDALDYVLARNGDPTSKFYGRIDAEHVGAVGHSQGAGGSVNAANKTQPGLVDTVVPICLPDYKFVKSPDDFSVSSLLVPVFYLGGSGDKFVAPPATLLGYFTQTSGAAALGVLVGASHNTIQRSGGGFLGYLTAWLMWQLQGDAYAAGAFTGLRPELNSNAGWQNQTEKFL